jgi:two-component system, NtrC family, response regulator
MGKILVIDDEDKLRRLLSRILTLEGYKVFEASGGQQAVRILDREDIHVIVSDVKLGDANGIDLARKIKAERPAVEIILMTAYGTIPDSVAAMKGGAFDFITKGDGEEQIIPAVARAMEKALSQIPVSLEAREESAYTFQSVIGNSQEIKKAIDLAGKVALTDSTVLLLGETGTGKEVFAGAIHHAGSRKDKKFVAVNCSAIARDLLESEMFGYKAGAFTGATKDKKGLFEEASGGTIFLDEIGEMSLDFQAKILRVLENHTFIKQGDTKETKVNVRIIAATNRNLEKEIEKGSFRSDLYYRLSTFTIQLPPLRERISDIEPIALNFLKICTRSSSRRIKGFDEEFLRRLKNYHFKGNIRELKNIIERAVILCENELITADLLPPGFSGNQALQNVFELSEVEKGHIMKVLQYTNGNKAKAAELLGIGEATLYRKLKEYHL